MYSLSHSSTLMTENTPDPIAPAVPPTPSPLDALMHRLRASPRDTNGAGGAHGGKRRTNGVKLTKDWRKTRRGYIGG